MNKVFNDSYINGKEFFIKALNKQSLNFFIEYTLLPYPALSLKTIGGILDFFVFIGENPEEVIHLYTSLIGRPVMPPFWGLGFQLCRWGFKGTENVREVIERNVKAKMPLV
jgi:alpha-glucosidase (family GH31 glycosyl hydrolase)